MCYDFRVKLVISYIYFQFRKCIRLKSRSVAEVRGVRGRADIGGDGRFLEANNVIPAVLHQMMRHRGTDDAALTNNHHTRFFG